MSVELLVLLGACFVAAFASGLAGFAFNLIAASILFHWMDPRTLAPVLVTTAPLFFAISRASSTSA